MTDDRDLPKLLNQIKVYTVNVSYATLERPIAAQLTALAAANQHVTQLLVHTIYR